MQLSLIHSNGINIYYDAVSTTDGYLAARTYALDGGGYLMPYSTSVQFAAMSPAAPIPEPAAV